MNGAAIAGGKLRRRDRFLKAFASRSRQLSPSPSISNTTNASSSIVQSSGTLSVLISTAASRQSAASPPAQPPSIHSISSGPQPGTPRQSSRHHILNGALQRLSDHDRATLQPFILSTTSDVNEAVERSLVAAKQKQRDCDAKRWTFTCAGRTVPLKEEADKVVRWLDRFKAVGDVAVNADPIHAGLPWAGVRFLLEVRFLSCTQAIPRLLTMDRLRCRRPTRWLLSWSVARRLST